MDGQTYRVLKEKEENGSVFGACSIATNSWLGARLDF